MTPTVAELTAHPERLDKDTLFALRELVARYPYYQAARLLFLKNLFILHDTSFGEELRRAAVYVPDRRVLFDMVEGANYRLKPERAIAGEDEQTNASRGERTVTLIDRFLHGSEQADDTQRRKAVTADATTDYMAYLMQMEDAEQDTPETETPATSRTGALIDDFIGTQAAGSRHTLQDTPEYTPDIDYIEPDPEQDEDYFTDTLAKIYIKQGRYEKAMEIISKLNLNFPKKNRYFADQMRFLQKLIINKKHNKEENV